jgi:hypothetical protein
MGGREGREERNVHKETAHKVYIGRLTVKE